MTSFHSVVMSLAGYKSIHKFKPFAKNAILSYDFLLISAAILSRVHKLIAPACFVRSSHSDPPEQVQVNEEKGIGHSGH